MKAMVLRTFRPIEKNPLELTDLPISLPGPEEILVRIKVCGVCHTDLHTVEGELRGVKLPAIPGHQIVGFVERAGEKCVRFQKGDRVGIAWLHSACGVCSFCRDGKENLCLNAHFTGYHADGGYAQYMVVPEKFAYSIPEIFSDEAAAPLLCAGIIGYRALRLSGVKPGQNLGLYGFGASAHVAIQVAVNRGCRVCVFSRSREHQELAKKLGALWTGTAKDEPPVQMNGSIIFAPAGELVLDALKNTERGGTVALAGIYMSPIPEMEYQKHIYHERVLRSVANATRQDGEELLNAAAAIPIRTITQVFPLEEANQVLRRLKEGGISGAAILRIPD
ncbi:MAG: zinc-dependent alcohol dehydrogenase family protein [Candidatus Aminicenantales bacterium]